MPIIISNDQPVKNKLEKENIFVISQKRAITQDIRPLRIAILNLMPEKQSAELDLYRLLSNTPLQLEITLLRMQTHKSKNESDEYLQEYYRTFEDVRSEKFDGMIITGAPVEHLEFEDVDYFEEFCEIQKWTKANVTSVINICWASQAALYYHYGINKSSLNEKCFGVFSHKIKHKKEPLFRGFDDTFYAPHSRHTKINEEELKANDKLNILAYSKEAGSTIIASRDRKQFFVTCHLEYERMRLDIEFRRDKDKNLDIKMPENYYPDNNIENLPNLSWRMASQLLFSNWINYYVYQESPYLISTIGEK
jgi:homoserine O-succinyltransferase